MPFTCMAQYALPADVERRPPRPLGEQRANAFSRRDQRNGRENALRAAETQAELPRLGQQSSLAAFHGPGEGPAGADGIHAVEIAEPRSLEHGLRIANLAQRPERKKGLVFKPLFLAAGRS